jgi:phosphate transport system permease protein
MPDNRRAIVSDRIFTLGIWAFGILGLLLPLLITGFLFVNGAHVLSWSFLTEDPSGFPLGQSGGIWPAIEGSLALVGIGLAIAFPLGVGGAVYLAVYGKNRRALKILRFMIECLAGIPSMIYGLFGYAFLVVFLSLKVSLLSGGITLGLMMFPIILVGSQEAIEAVQWQYRESALSLGVTKSYLTRRIILIKAWPGILAATVLTAGHAVGSAAPVLYTASTIFSHSGLSLDAPVMTLATHLYYLVGQALSFDHAFGTAFILVAGLLMVNFSALYLKKIAPR